MVAKFEKNNAERGEEESRLSFAESMKQTLGKIFSRRRQERDLPSNVEGQLLPADVRRTEEVMDTITDNAISSIEKVAQQANISQADLDSALAGLAWKDHLDRLASDSEYARKLAMEEITEKQQQADLADPELTPIIRAIQDAKLRGRDSRQLEDILEEKKKLRLMTAEERERYLDSQRIQVQREDARREEFAKKEASVIDFDRVDDLRREQLYVKMDDESRIQAEGDKIASAERDARVDEGVKEKLLKDNLKLKLGEGKEIDLSDPIKWESVLADLKKNSEAVYAAQSLEGQYKLLLKKAEDTMRYANEKGQIHGDIEGELTQLASDFLFKVYEECDRYKVSLDKYI